MQIMLKSGSESFPILYYISPTKSPLSSVLELRKRNKNKNEILRDDDFMKYFANSEHVQM